MEKNNLQIQLLSVLIAGLILCSFIFNGNNNREMKNGITFKGKILSVVDLYSKNIYQSKEKRQNEDDKKSIDKNWYANALKHIESDEYNFEYDKNLKLYSAFNRKNNLRFTYSSDGFKTEPGMTKIPLFDLKDKTLDDSKKKYKELPAWSANIKLKGIGRTDRKSLINFEGKEIIVKDSIASIEDENLKMYYLNNESGMRQDFIVKKKPEGEGNLILKLNIESKEKVNVNNDGITFKRRKTKESLFSYTGLKIWDKNGKILEGKFVSISNHKNSRINIEVNDDNAEYPITIDPLSSSPNWTVTGENNGGNFGCSVSTAGDVNGDGYSDIIIGAYTYSSYSGKGKAYVYYGSSSGPSATPNWTATGEQDSVSFGYSVSTAGDVNGDGYSDIIIGAYGYPNYLYTGKGKAYVFYGSSSGLSSTSNWTAVGESNGDNFGYCVSTAGDVNGDGYSDVITSSPKKDSTKGKVYLYHGSSSGLSSTPNWTKAGEKNDDAFGSYVSTAGDINGDGYSDIIIGAARFTYNNFTHCGKSYVFHGSSSGLPATANWSALGENTNDFFGMSVSTSGDVNGDGYSDIIIGSNNYSNNRGKVYAYYGNASGLPTTASWTAMGENNDNLFGWSISTAGDLNGDGYCDIIIGAIGYSSKGRIYVYYGNGSGLASWSWTADGENTYDGFGWSVSVAGDVNGDGLSEVIAGACHYSNYKGKVYLYYGSPIGIGSYPNWFATGENNNDHFGYRVFIAGDVNGDGYSDVVIGANGFSNYKGKVYAYYGSSTGLSTSPNWTATGESNSDMLGYSISTAGDVNRDGYSDVIIGVPGHNGGNYGQGKVYVYYGGSTGLSTSPNWTVIGENSSDLFGYSVSTAGDVNGDGYSDIIIGAFGYYKGKVYAYYGSSTGPSNIPNWTVTGENQNDGFAYSLSTAGDVNGDGFSDIIVGADMFSIWNGKVYVYYGSSSGLSPTPNWTAIGENTDDAFGYSVSTAGDVNGDGYCDIVAGARYGSSFKGKVYIYLGSISGLSSSPNWTAEGENVFDMFGNSVSTAGDVNGDGYSDVIIGAWKNSDSAGAVYIYYGGSSGLSSVYSWKVTGPPGSDLGRSVSAAGDVNGDGYSDLIIGADGNLNNKGLVFVLYGNIQAGIRSTPQQYKPGTTNIVSPGGLTTVNNQVRLSLFGKSPFGRTKGKLVYEIKNSCTPFSGNPITNSTSYTGISSNWTDLTTLGTQINDDISGILQNQDYKWRVRVKYNPASNPYQVYGPWKYYKNYLPIPTGGFKPSNAPIIEVRNISTITPGRYALYQNYPNPFNPTTKIRFDIPNHQPTTNNVQLTIYDILGREVATLVNEKLQPGTYEVGFDGTNLPSGIYFYRLTMDNYNQTNRMILLK
jgi:hypothetical protein